MKSLLSSFPVEALVGMVPAAIDDVSQSIALARVAETVETERDMMKGIGLANILHNVLVEKGCTSDARRLFDALNTSLIMWYGVPMLTEAEYQTLYGNGSVN